jgi:hypothetical protein
MVEAKRCNPGLNRLTCQETAPSSLPCGGCTTHVEDTTELNAIRAKWNAANCKSGICPAIACVLPGVGTCFPTDGGGGVCGSAYPVPLL